MDSSLVLTTIAKGGTGQVTCQWTPATGLSNPNDCNPTFTPTAPGTYPIIVTATDSLGCTDTDTVVVTVENCCMLMAAAVPDTTVCDMDTAFLDVIISGGATPYSCVWMPTTGLSNPNICDPFVTGLPLGPHTFYVTVTDSLGCTATDSVVVTVGNCCLVLTGPTSDPFNLNNMNNPTLRGLDFWDVDADGIEDLGLCVQH